LNTVKRGNIRAFPRILVVDKSALVPLIRSLRAELAAEESSNLVRQAQHQCDRLEQAFLQSHAEGLRFASFTLTRLMQQPGANLRSATVAAGKHLKDALDAAGYSHQH